MSKRYGRNQKRAHRAAIDSLEKNLAAARATNQTLEMLGARHRRSVEQTAEVLGRHFITMPPEVKQVRYLQDLANKYRIAMAKPYSALGDAAPYLEHVLPVLRGSHVVVDELRHHVHIKFMYGDEQVGYAISEKALLMLGAQDATQYMAEAMANQIVRQVHERHNGSRP